MPEILRKFNDEGISRFREFITVASETGDLSQLTGLLQNEELTEPVRGPIYVEERAFANKMEIAVYLHQKISGADIESPLRDRGIWTWLAAYYFEQICSTDADGHIKEMDKNRYILTSSRSDRIFRHLLAGPVLIYDIHRENAIILLYNKVNQTGDFVSQLTGRTEITMNRGVIEAAKQMYIHPDTNRPIRGSSPTEHSPGTLRRFTDVVQQFQLTYDLYSMSGEEILRLLPLEFEQWRMRELPGNS